MTRHPLSWYVEKLERGEPFTSLLYGDGEFYVAARARTGETLQNGEVVTRELEDEMIASLDDTSPDVVRGTDLNLLDYENYQGGDKRSIVAIGKMIEGVLANHPAHEWVDGVVWEDAVRAGQLWPLVKALRGDDTFVTFVGNERMRPVANAVLHAIRFVLVPGENACAHLDDIAGRVEVFTRSSVVVVCMGLGAVPLIMRLRKRFPGCTFLDLGSVFDVFAGRSPERAWRAELYADPPALMDLVWRNLGGVL